MTRKDAKAIFRDDVDSYGKPKKIMSKIDKIFDYFEAKIKELEKLQNRRCESCIFSDNIEDCEELYCNYEECVYKYRVVDNDDICKYWENK